MTVADLCRFAWASLVIFSSGVSSDGPLSGIHFLCGGRPDRVHTMHEVHSVLVAVSPIGTQVRGVIPEQGWRHLAVIPDGRAERSCAVSAHIVPDSLDVQLATARPRYVTDVAASYPAIVPAFPACDAVFAPSCNAICLWDETIQEPASTSITIVRIAGLKGLFWINRSGTLSDYTPADDLEDDVTELSDLSRITALNLVRATDEQMAVFAKCSNLKTLDLANPYITDDGYRAMEKLVGLERCDIRCGRGSTLLTDAGVSHFSHLRELKQLVLCGTTVTDDGLASLENLQQLTLLIITSNMIQGPGFSHLGRLQKLEVLEVGWPLLGRPRRSRRTFDEATTRTFNDGLRHLADLRTLNWLDLGDTPVTDEGLPYLTRLPTLERLNLDWTYVTDAGVLHLKSMPKLKGISLEGTNVTREGMKRLHDAMPNVLMGELDQEQGRSPNAKPPGPQRDAP
jgi:hypothetical protein